MKVETIDDKLIRCDRKDVLKEEYSISQLYGSSMTGRIKLTVKQALYIAQFIIENEGMEQMTKQECIICKIPGERFCKDCREEYPLEYETWWHEQGGEAGPMQSKGGDR